MERKAQKAELKATTLLEESRQRKAAIEAAKEEAQTAPVKDEIDALANGKLYNFRLALDGTATRGHWIGSGDAVPTGTGFKFTVKNEGGLFYLENKDYGWIDKEVITDEAGNAYDETTVNRIGYEFKKPYRDAKAVFEAALDWLVHMEKQYA